MPLPYPIREGLAGFRRAPFAAFAATSAMVVALVLIGLFAFLTLEGQRVTRWLRERVGEMELYLEEGTGIAASQALTARAGLTPGITTATYVSTAEAREVFAEEFGEDARLFDDDFLPASIRVRVAEAYANPDSLARLEARFKAYRGVEDVGYDADLLVRVQGNLRLLRLGGFALVLFVVVGALFLVANTIRLTIYARRLLIRTMKLVGATDSFIRRPFVVEGLVQGLVAGLVSAGVLWGVLGLIRSVLPVELAASGQSAFVTLLPALLALGLGLAIGWGGTLFAVRRFIRRVALH